MAVGVVKWCKASRGFGFIVTEDGAKRTVVGKSALTSRAPFVAAPRRLEPSVVR